LTATQVVWQLHRHNMASIKEQIAALKTRFDTLQASLAQQAKSNVELRIKLAQLSKSIDLLVEAEEKANLLQDGRQAETQRPRS
jgi:chromosome segregation ATPase